MAERICYHCKEVIEAGAPHDCWTTTEAALTGELSEDLRDAWERLRATAAKFGEQRIYASGHCIMFARQTAYFFVRPKRSALELCVFLGRTIVAPQIRRAEATSRTKVAHIIHVRHRDEVEAPITDWMREAYELSDELSRAGSKAPKVAKAPKAKGSKGAKETPASAADAATARSRQSSRRQTNASGGGKAARSPTKANARKTTNAAGKRSRKTASGARRRR